MRRIVLGSFLIGSLAMAQEPAPAPTPPPAAAPPVLRLPFAWPNEGQVRVTKDGDKEGDRAVMDYTLRFAPREGGGLLVRHADFVFRSVNGEDATAPERVRELGPLLTVTSLLPELAVDANGAAVGVGSLDGLLTKAEAEVAEQPKGPGRAAVERMLQAMRQPVAQEAGKAGLFDDWSSWVGAWTGDLPESGGERQFAGEVVHLGATLPAQITVRHRGDVAEHPGHVRLTRVAIAEGHAAKAAFAAWFTAVLAEAGQTFDSERVQSVRVELGYDAVTDPKTLRPLKVQRTRVAKIRVRGRRAMDARESTTFTFVW
jgi:hypothetical protein